MIQEFFLAGEKSCLVDGFSPAREKIPSRQLGAGRASISDGTDFLFGGARKKSVPSAGWPRSPGGAG